MYRLKPKRQSDGLLVCARGSIQNKRITIIFIVIAFFRFGYSQVTSPEPYKLFVTLEDAPFEDLYLFEYTEDRRITLEGKQIKKDTWEFTVPDSIIRNSENMNLKVSNYGSISNSITSVSFISEKVGKKTRIGNLGVEGKNNYIFAKYKEKTITPDQYIILRTQDSRDSLITADLINFSFSLLPQNNANSDIMIRAEASSFSKFDDKKRSYEDYLESYSAIAKQYPDSRYLMTSLATMLTKYKTKDDIKIIYDNLSDKHKDGYFGKRIERFLGGKFENQQLPSLHTDTYENIVQDSSKFNLIVFTASWCVPCIKEIPLLKEVYKDLGEKLELTYISIDKQEDVPDFLRLMREHEVPWRTLLSYENTVKIEEKYFVESIPHGILVSPNLDMEVIDVRDIHQRENLYNRLIKNDNVYLNKFTDGYEE
ncbi:redoxin domain-containing protein [Sphingobacterium olei]|uniref:Redoxin domain-containing protein n=1 Tax=Sphingobacterium olei TaxID=2571155 RepID=A0A4U0N863_9SPHI|nr:thioredoxin-like domain-containing protein [Sphingobacterium olei]TJZ50047.1 redoxin domain-containing protein [Sphingobacterium olei]